MDILSHISFIPRKLLLLLIYFSENVYKILVFISVYFFFCTTVWVLCVLRFANKSRSDKDEKALMTNQIITIEIERNAILKLKMIYWISVRELTSPSKVIKYNIYLIINFFFFLAWASSKSRLDPGPQNIIIRRSVTPHDLLNSFNGSFRSRIFVRNDRVGFPNGVVSRKNSDGLLARIYILL